MEIVADPDQIWYTCTDQGTTTLRKFGYDQQSRGLQGSEKSRRARFFLCRNKVHLNQVMGVSLCLED